MEQIEVAISPFTRRSRSMSVAHSTHAISRGLDLGEHVLVHDAATGEHVSAVVADVDFGLEDTSYRLELGGRITAEEAAEWTTPNTSGRYTTREIVDLLAELRRSERDVSAAIADLMAH